LKPEVPTDKPQEEARPETGGPGAGAGAAAPAGEAPKWVEIDLQDLYNLGHIDIMAVDLLEKILDAYNLDYEILVNCNPDIGCEYAVDDNDFMRKFSEAQGRQEGRRVIEEYARKKGATAIVELFDGYETAFALIYGREEQ